MSRPKWKAGRPLRPIKVKPGRVECGRCGHRQLCREAATLKDGQVAVLCRKCNVPLMVDLVEVDAAKAVVSMRTPCPRCTTPMAAMRLMRIGRAIPMDPAICLGCNLLIQLNAEFRQRLSDRKMFRASAPAPAGGTDVDP